MRKALVVLFLASLLSSCAKGPVTLSNEEMKTVKLAAMEFGAKLGEDLAGCSGQDSEPDGYVSCTFSKRSTSAVVNHQCSYKGDAGGCK